MIHDNVSNYRMRMVMWLLMWYTSCLGWLYSSELPLDKNSPLPQLRSSVWLFAIILSSCVKIRFTFLKNGLKHFV